MGGGQTPGEDVGNGRATAIVLAREGARVVVADRSRGSAQETVDIILSEKGEGLAVETDVTSEESVKRAVAETLARYGKLDILHNNVRAGKLLPGDSPATEITEETFDRSWAINFKSAWLSSKHAMPALRESHGSLVNISSSAVYHAYPLIGYKATKHAVVGLTEHLAAENARYGVRVNAILPGSMNTAMVISPEVDKGRDRQEVIAERVRRIPLAGRVGTGWDIAYAALFLHSDEAGFITGISLLVDGGEEAASYPGRQ
jgi:NAD(P)-dependent dehydrogenase (short-subunit alcohol dehydrogenase family)